jgi:hypothetical protein
MIEIEIFFNFELFLLDRLFKDEDIDLEGFDDEPKIVSHESHEEPHEKDDHYSRVGVKVPSQIAPAIKSDYLEQSHGSCIDVLEVVTIPL